MEAIVFIGASTSGSSMDALLVAEKLGYDVILLTDRKAFIRKKLAKARITYLESMDKESVRKKIVQLHSVQIIRAIISFVDPYVSMAADLSNEFCGSSISSDALRLMEDKGTTRFALRNNPASCGFEMIHSDRSTPSIITYPLIMKNPISNGSKDVYLIENEQELEISVRKLTKHKSDKYILVEELLEGPQYVIEVLVVDTIPIIVAVIQQEINHDYTFIVTAYDVVTQMDENVYRNLWKTVTSIIHEISLQTGSCHFEMRLTPNGWKLIELNPRISGGAMNRMIEEAFGINLAQETIKLYLGEEPDLIRKKQQSVYTSFITINSTGYLLAVDGVEQAASYPGVVDVHVKPSIGAAVMPPLSMGNRCGYVMAVGESSETAKERAENAARLIKFYVEPF